MNHTFTPSFYGLKTESAEHDGHSLDVHGADLQADGLARGAGGVGHIDGAVEGAEGTDDGAELAAHFHHEGLGAQHLLALAEHA